MWLHVLHQHSSAETITDSWTLICTQGVLESILHCYPTICLFFVFVFGAKKKNLNVACLGQILCACVEEVSCGYRLLYYTNTVWLDLTLDSWTSVCSHSKFCTSSSMPGVWLSYLEKYVYACAHRGKAIRKAQTTGGFTINHYQKAMILKQLAACYYIMFYHTLS